MRKSRFDKKRSALIVIKVLITSMLLCACTKRATFSGSKVGDENHFDIDFEILNTSYSHELEMKDGETIGVIVEAESGNISLVIQKGDDDPIYRGNNLASTKFQVGVETEGTYTLTVTGKNARGHVVMTRVGS